MASYYLRECTACRGQGLLLFTACPSCGAILVVCDECDSTWSDAARIAVELSAPADGSWPTCSECSKTIPPNSDATPEQIERAFPGLSPRKI